MSTKEERDRLFEIIKKTGLRKGEFAKKLEVSPQALNFYLDGKNDYQVITRKMSFLGVSIDWLYTGIGNPTFQPDIFEDQFGVLNVHEESKQKLRILQWIQMNYDSITAFEAERGMGENELESILLGDDVIIHDMLVKLDNAGINIKWTIDGRGSMFNDKLNGKRLEEKYNSEVKNKIIKLKK